MRRLPNLLHCVLCALIFVSGLELCARVDDALSFGAPLRGAYSDKNLYLTDQIGQWGKPGARYQRWQLNSLGYRGPELREGTVRLVCFGSSETFGLYEAPGEEFPRQLERDLNNLAGGPDFEVVNAAYPGETLRTAIRRVPQVIRQTHPGYALIYPAVANYIPSAPGSGGPTNSSRLSEWLGDSRVAERVHNVLKAALPERIQTALRKWQIQRDAAQLAVLDRLPERNISQFREDLVALIHILRDSGVEPVLATHATIFGMTLSPSDRDLLTAWRKFYPVLKEDGFLDMEERMNQVIRETADREDVTLIDIARTIPPGRQDFADFTHFTTAGAGIMAADLAAGLKPLLFSPGTTSNAMFSVKAGVHLPAPAVSVPEIR